MILKWHILCMLGTAALMGCGARAFAQAPGVEIVRDRGEPLKMFVDKANALREAGALLSKEAVAEQMSRSSCELTLPAVSTQPLTDREI